MKMRVSHVMCGTSYCNILESKLIYYGYSVALTICDIIHCSEPLVFNVNHISELHFVDSIRFINLELKVCGFSYTTLHCTSSLNLDVMR